jgi:mono/diheme cytochrome c family protein
MATCLLVAALVGGTTIGAVFTAGARQSSPAPPAASTTAPAAGAQGRSTWDGVYTEAQAKRGEELYTAHCASCHRDSLDGEGPAKPLIGPSFLDNWNGLTMGAMAERTRTTMPFNQPATLSRQQIVDVLAFMLRVNKFPAGGTELPRQNDMLEQIKFLAIKP